SKPGPTCDPRVDGGTCCSFANDNGECDTVDICSAIGLPLDCDEPSDCAAGNVCCLHFYGTTDSYAYSSSCKKSCAAGEVSLCKSRCDCQTCAVAAPCGMATCGGKCPTVPG